MTINNGLNQNTGKTITNVAAKRVFSLSFQSKITKAFQSYNKAENIFRNIGNLAKMEEFGFSVN